MEIGNLEAIKEMVKLDLGVAILAPWSPIRTSPMALYVCAQWIRKPWAGAG